MKLKCSTLLKPLGTIIQENFWSFYPSEPFRITRFKMRHPVWCHIKDTIHILFSSQHYQIIPITLWVWQWWFCNVWTKKNMISDLSIFIQVIDILNFSQTFCRLMIHDDLFFSSLGRVNLYIMISSYKCSILLGLDKAKQRFFPAWNWNCK